VSIRISKSKSTEFSAPLAAQQGKIPSKLSLRTGLSFERSCLFLGLVAQNLYQNDMADACFSGLLLSGEYDRFAFGFFRCAGWLVIDSRSIGILLDGLSVSGLALCRP
jgi:hypothetical protein